MDFSGVLELEVLGKVAPRWRCCRRCTLIIIGVSRLSVQQIYKESHNHMFAELEEGTSWAPTTLHYRGLFLAFHSSTPETFKVQTNGKISGSWLWNCFTPLDTIVLQHTEFRQFTSPRSGSHFCAYGNAYYHAKKRCIQLKWTKLYSFCSGVLGTWVSAWRPSSVRFRVWCLDTMLLIA